MSRVTKMQKLNRIKRLAKEKRKRWVAWRHDDSRNRVASLMDREIHDAMQGDPRTVGFRMLYGRQQ